ncbi:hypothetical protein [Nocardia terpenica]|uniref:hypothetical protein n=1 Tax=Nocardia terpenica TaxID=455432 RepID=UPI0012FDFA66|nr:hypothetical protein [Nocardia terpenica]
MTGTLVYWIGETGVDTTVGKILTYPAIDPDDGTADNGFAEVRWAKGEFDLPPQRYHAHPGPHHPTDRCCRLFLGMRPTGRTGSCAKISRTALDGDTGADAVCSQERSAK